MSDNSQSSPYFGLPDTLNPVPAEFAEPLEKALNELQSRNVLLFLSSSEIVSDNWLKASPIEKILRDSPLEAPPMKVWQLLDNLWIISLEVRSDSRDPINAHYINSLQRTLVEQLSGLWQTENTASESVNQADNYPPLFRVTTIAPLSTDENLDDNISELNELLEIIINKQLHSQFQPIVDLRDGQVLGYEALIRGPKGAPLRRPGAMFKAADKARMVSWYDIACQEKCFALAAQNKLKKLLFINMDAEGLAYLDAYDRSLAMRAREYGISPSSVVVEITERQTLDDYPQLVKFIKHLREDGFKIAIDDAGSGYNSLYTIADLRPEFVKIDRNLVRNIDVRGETRALLDALVHYARHIGTAVLAEGAETREELATLIDLGIPYGQGYLMGKPQDDFRGVGREVREFIQRRYQIRTKIVTGRTVTVGEMANRGVIAAPDEPLALAAKAFAKNPSLTSVTVVEDGFVRGQILRNRLQHVLDMATAAKVGNFLPDEIVSQWMSTQMLLVDSDSPISLAARQSTTQSEVSLEADIIVVAEGDKYIGVIPSRTLIEAVTHMQENRVKYSDPISGFPGRLVLEQSLEERLKVDDPFVLIRVDINHLERYNRRYGVSHGDVIIQTLARLLQESTAVECGIHPQIFHLGGDDMLILAEAAYTETICEKLVSGFGKLLPQFYPGNELRQGYVEFMDGGESLIRVPLMTLAVAAQTSRALKFAHIGQLAESLEALLHSVKMLPISQFVIDQPLASLQSHAA